MESDIIIGINAFGELQRSSSILLTKVAQFAFSTMFIFVKDLNCIFDQIFYCEIFETPDLLKISDPGVVLLLDVESINFS